LAGPLVVLDTQVVISALIGPEQGSSRLVVEAVATSEVRLAISDDFLREVSRVIRYLDVVTKIRDPIRAFDVGLEIGLAGEWNNPRRLDWPSVRDPNDGWLLDLAWNASADFIVSRDPHLLEADLPFPIEVVEPVEILNRLPH
jgi:putative PIN family toxin of toxin-antitoxin system